MSAIEKLNLVKRYLRSADILDEIIENSGPKAKSLMNEFSREISFPGGYKPFSHPDHFKAAMLYAVCRLKKPKVVVETGVAQGHSSLGILYALEKNETGHLYSIDLPNGVYVTDNGERWSDINPYPVGWLVPIELRKNWTLSLGSSKEELPKILSNIDAIDLFYHDSEHTVENISFEFKTCWPKMAKSGILMADNSNWNSAFKDLCLLNGIRPKLLFPFVGIARRQEP